MNTTNTNVANPATPTDPRPAPEVDNEQLATRVINVALAHNRPGHRVGADIARLIAAAIHPGPHSSLCRFAATGELDVTKAATELRACDPFGTPSHWRAALTHFIESRGRP